MEEVKIKVSMTCRLHGSTQRMTVVEVGEDASKVIAGWHDTRGEFHRREFPIDDLEFS